MNATDTLTLTVTGTWNGPGAAPTTVPVLETSYAGYTASGQPGSQLVLSQSADDGLGDPVVPDGRPNGGVSQGSHLTTVPVQGGSWSFTRTLKAVSNCSQTMPPTAGNLSASVSIGNYTAQIDTRAVMISCPAVDASQYRDPPLTGNVIVNKRGSDGTLRGDTMLITVKPSDQVTSPAQSFNYHANVFGNWASSGTYHWFSDLTGYSGSGNLPTVTDFSDTIIPYTTTVGSIDHIFVSMYDGIDGAKATGNYYLHLHAQYEPTSWPEDSGSPYKVMGTDPNVPSWPTYPWKNISPLNEGTFPTTSFPVTYKEAGIESVDGGLDLGADPVVLHFGVTGNPTSSFPYANTLTPQPALKQGGETWVVSREIVARHKGHLDIYGVHGYTKTGVWRHDIMQGIDVNLYQPYQLSSTLAFDPTAGWNPPGYK